MHLYPVYNRSLNTNAYVIELTSLKQKHVVHDCDCQQRSTFINLTEPACCRQKAAVPAVSAKQCYGCGVVRPAEWFAAGKGPTGLQSRCKACHSHDNQERTEQLKREHASREPATQKLCRACQKTLPVTSFTADLQNKDGLQGTCRSCRTRTEITRARERAVRLREHPSKAPQPKALICAGCHEMKPGSEFTKHYAAAFGVRSTCKECEKERRSAVNRKLRVQENAGAG